MANLKTGASRKQSTPNFPKGEHFLPPDKKCSFFGKFDEFYFLETSVLRFSLLPYYRRVYPRSCDILFESSETPRQVTVSNIYTRKKTWNGRCTVAENERTEGRHIIEKM